MSNLLQEENLPKKVQKVMENRIVDCEICQQACPWNIKHHKNPFVTNMTEFFRKKIEDWERLFYLPDLVELSDKGYREKLGHLNTSIPYKTFQRNVLIAMERATKMRDA